MKKLITAIIALTALVSFGQTTFYLESADGSPALRVKNGGTEAVTINIYEDNCATNSVIIGSTANTIDCSGTTIDVISELSAAISAATNSAGAKVLVVDDDCSLAADSIDEELMVATVSIAAGAVGEVKWDTSDVARYDVYIPNSRNSNTFDGTKRASCVVEGINGSLLGTGNVTASLYVDGTLAWQTYCATQYDGSTNSLNTIVLPVEVGYPLGDTKAGIIRVTRTTATTGTIVVETDNIK